MDLNNKQNRKSWGMAVEKPELKQTALSEEEGVATLAQLLC